MNNNQQFDDHIKEQFINSSPDVPAYTWDAIVAKGKKRKPAGLLISILNRRNLLIMLGILLAGVSGAWLINNNIFTSNNNERENIAKASANKNEIDNNNGEITTAPLPDNTITATTNNNDKPQISAPVAVNRNTVITTNNPSSNITRSSITSRVNMRIYQATPSERVINNPTDKNSATTTATTAGVENNEEELNAGLPIGGTLLGRLEYDIERRNRLKAADVLGKRNTPDVLLPKCPIEKNVSGNKKYVEVYSSIDYGLRSLKDSGNSNSAYVQKRKESTKFSSAYSAGIRYTKVFNNSMSVRGGFNYSQINEKFTLVQGNVVQVVYIINAAGDTTGSYTTTGTRYKTTHNKYRTIDIPLMVGYEMGNGRLHTNINIGPVINIYSWQKGEVLDYNGQPVSITTGKSNSIFGFKTNAGIGFMGAISLYYKLTDRLHILGEPYFRYNFNQMNKDAITFKQKYNTLGFRIGVRMDIP